MLGCALIIDMADGRPFDLVTKRQIMRAIMTISSDHVTLILDRIRLKLKDTVKN